MSEARRHEETEAHTLRICQIAQAAPASSPAPMSSPFKVPSSDGLDVDTAQVQAEADNASFCTVIGPAQVSDRSDQIYDNWCIEGWSAPMPDLPIDQFGYSASDSDSEIDSLSEAESLSETSDTSMYSVSGSVNENETLDDLFHTSFHSDISSTLSDDLADESTDNNWAPWPNAKVSIH